MIKPGNRVIVYFERVEAEYNVEVVCVPQRPYEAWELKRTNGETVYVQQYSKMVKMNPIPKKVETVLASAAIAAVKVDEGDKKP